MEKLRNPNPYEARITLLEAQLAQEVSNHNVTRQQLTRVKYRLDLIQARIAWLMGDSLPDETLDEIKEAIDAIEIPS